LGKNIIIQTDGVSHTYNGVEEIHTQDKDGNRTTWVPLDGTNLGVKTITQSGTYKASDDGYYAYSKVIVNAKAKAVGKKEDGNTYAIATNDQGETVEVLLPDTIKIETAPTKQTYDEGESIDLAGAVVMAYNGDGTVWHDVDHLSGIIPVSELHPAPQKASTTVSIVDGGGGSVEYTSDLVYGQTVYPLLSLSAKTREDYGAYKCEWTKDYRFLGKALLVKQYVASNTGNLVCRMFFTGELVITTTEVKTYKRSEKVDTTVTQTILNADEDEMAGSYTHDGKTIKILGRGASENSILSYNGHMYNNVELNNEDVVEYLWTLVHGTPIQTTPATQKITVLWSRPEDNMALSDTFNVSVNFVNDEE